MRCSTNRRTFWALITFQALVLVVVVASLIIKQHRPPTSTAPALEHVGCHLR